MPPAIYLESTMLFAPASARPVLIFCIVMIFARITHAESPVAQVTVGPARFTVITADCIRIEYNANGPFINEPSYFAANRDARFADATS
jgi:hypothetical protein